MLKVSKRGSMEAFIVMDCLAKANKMERGGQCVYRFEAGQPSFKTPKPVIKAAMEVLDENAIGYTDPMGETELREKIAQHYKDKYKLNVSIDQIVITAGSSAAFTLSFLACFEPNDRVAIAFPCYPSYKRILKAFGACVVPILAEQSDGYHPTVKLLKKAQMSGKIDGLIIASPNNPTGAVMSRQNQIELIEYCKQNEIRVISDELYHGVEFASRDTNHKSDSALLFDKNCIVINSFSKYFCMTGWRLGWLIVPKDMVLSINNLQSNLFISAPTISQRAAIKAFDCTDELDKNVIRYEKNRDLFVRELTNMGIGKFAYPSGGFYLYADISHLTDNSIEWANELLKTAKVAVAAGVDFDNVRGNTTIRFSYVCDYNHAKAGLEKLKQFIEMST